MNKIINESSSWTYKTRVLCFEPQSEEMQKQQNVVFADKNEGEMDVVPSFIDYTRLAPFTNDTTLENFFERPIKIANYSWAPYTPLFEKIKPWKLFFENKRVSNRISNFRLAHCKLHLKFIINGNPFSFGRLLVSYNPNNTYDNLTMDRAFFTIDAVEASQRPHVYLNPTRNEGGEMSLPYFWFENAIDLTGSAFNDMGELSIRSFGNLLMASLSTSPVKISIFAWATGVELAVPTQFNSGGLLPQTDEYSIRPISSVASAIANVSSKLTQAPLIGPYARATTFAAQTVAAVAQLFGFSKPAMLESNLVQPRTKTSMAVVNTLDDTTKLSLDQKQEITIDPRTVGLSGEDEMSILSIASRFSYVDTFWWHTDYNTEFLLWNTIVDPCVTPRSGQENHLPAVAFATYPFLYWRGSLRYKFDIVCTGFHKGRLKFVYDPTATALQGLPGEVSAEYNTSRTTIVDIADTQSVIIDVPWGQPTTYSHHLDFPNSSLAYGTDRLNYTSYISNFGNGTLSVYVVNELQLPSSDSSMAIFLLVSVSAGPDFEVAVPTSKYLTSMRVTPDANLEPQSQEYIAPRIATTDNTNMIHFGESVRSIRQVLKRYCLSEYVPISESDPPNSKLITFCRYPLPLDGGYCKPGAVNAMPVYGTVFGPYVYAYNTFLNYFTHAFGGWRGAIRYTVSTADAGCCNVSTIVSHDQSVAAPYWISTTIGTICEVCNPTPTGNLSLLYNHGTDIFEGHSGISVQNNSVNTTHSFELPYYSNFRFTPAKHTTVYQGQGVDLFSRNWYFSLRGTNIPIDANAALYCAAGDDFSLHMFLGSPVLYSQIAFPAL